MNGFCSNSCKKTSAHSSVGRGTQCPAGRGARVEMQKSLGFGKQPWPQQEGEGSRPLWPPRGWCPLLLLLPSDKLLHESWVFPANGLPRACVLLITAAAITMGLPTSGCCTGCFLTLEAGTGRWHHGSQMCSPVPVSLTRAAIVTPTSAARLCGYSTGLLCGPGQCAPSFGASGFLNRKLE